jgi:hypothetical protein
MILLVNFSLQVGSLTVMGSVLIYNSLYCEVNKGIKK